MFTRVVYVPPLESASTSRERPKSDTLQVMFASTRIFLAAKSYRCDKSTLINAIHNLFLAVVIESIL